MNKFLNLAKATKIKKPFNEAMIINAERYILRAECELDRMEHDLTKSDDIRWYIENAKELISMRRDPMAFSCGFDIALREDLYNIHDGLSELKRA